MKSTSITGHVLQVYRQKKVIAKNTKAKAREPDYLKLLSIFVVIGPDYKKMLPYNCSNSNGKINSKVYKQLLTQIAPDIQGKTLY